MGILTAVLGLNPYSIGRYSVRKRKSVCKQFCKGRLNPYSIGRYSVSGTVSKCTAATKSLNPYSIGRYSVRQLH